MFTKRLPTGDWFSALVPGEHDLTIYDFLSPPGSSVHAG